MIKDLKELQMLLKLCRKQGVTEINLGGTLIKFGDLPSRKQSDDDEADEVPTEALSQDEMIFFSARPPEGN